MADTCKGCGKPVLGDEPRYTGREPEENWHWNCHQAVRDKYEATRKELPALMARVDASLARIRKIMK